MRMLCILCINSDSVNSLFWLSMFEYKLDRSVAKIYSVAVIPVQLRR